MNALVLPWSGWLSALTRGTIMGEKTPEHCKPVLAPARPQGDRVQAVFSGLDDLKRFLVERREAAAR